MILFVCESLFQLFNAINLRTTLFKDESVDICVCEKTGLFQNVIGFLKKSKVFDQVYYYGAPMNAKQDLLNKVKKIIYAHKILSHITESLPDIKYDYNKVFVSGAGLSSASIYYFIHRHNKNTKCCLYEDGMFEYVVYTNKELWSRRLISKLLFGEYYLDTAVELYVYEPNLTINIPTHIRKIAIPKIENYQNRQLYNMIYNFDDKGLDVIDRCSYIYVDTCFFDESSSVIQYDIVEWLYKKVGDKLLVKLHPRSDIHKYDKIGVTCLKSSQIMELIVMNKKLTHCTFLSSISTAIFNMKSVFNQTPKLIILNNIFNICGFNQGIAKYIHNFIFSYPKDKIFQPQNSDELFNLI